MRAALRERISIAPRARASSAHFHCGKMPQPRRSGFPARHLRQDAAATSNHAISAVDLQPQVVRGTADAGVVVADQVLAAAGGVVVLAIHDLRHKGLEIGFDLSLVLCRRGDDTGFGNQAVVADAIAVIEQSAGRFGGVAAAAGARLDCGIDEAAQTVRRVLEEL